MKNHDGFTLIEVLIAMAIFAIGILALGAMQIAAIKGNSFSNKMTEASTVAQDQIEKLIAEDFDSTDLEDKNGDGTAGIDCPSITEIINGGDQLLNTGGNGTPDHGRAENIGGCNFYIYWNVADISSFAKKIRVIVAWNQGGMHRIALNYIKNK